MINLNEEEYKSMCNSSLEKAKELFNPNNYYEELIKYRGGNN